MALSLGEPSSPLGSQPCPTRPGRGDGVSSGHPSSQFPCLARAGGLELKPRAIMETLEGFFLVVVWFGFRTSWCPGLTAGSLLWGHTWWVSGDHTGCQGSNIFHCFAASLAPETQHRQADSLSCAEWAIHSDVAFPFFFLRKVGCLGQI